ncbi:hypothetical protein [Phaffia rhodozyma]|uniref:Uncharacterized protein n=1 Tax=Phaffia rhodozyma TaxID=264483 RepID=A0A0F7SEV5_PHARH|nr:hypothetical protein [Phaffia rhodozyma]
MNITWVPSGSIVSTEFNLILIPTTDNTQVLSNISFTATDNSYTLPALPLTKNVEFIAMLQDRTDGASQGRVSQIVRTSDSDGAGTDCLADLPHYLDFVFSIEFENGTSNPTQCATTTVYDWNNATAPIGISGLIPGGESFNVPITDMTNQRADWTTAIPAGTNVMFIMSDGGPRGSGGSTGIYTVAAGSSSCFTAGAEIYSSLPIGDVPTTQTVTTTVTAPAGSPSGSSSSTTGDVSRKTSHVGAIAGGVVGGLAGLAILAGLFFWLSKRKEKKNETEKEEMMGVARPWSPPVPEDPENVRTSAYLSGVGVGAGAAGGALGGLGNRSSQPGSISSPQFGRQNESFETTQAQYQLTPLNSPFGNGTYPPSSFSHIPPGSVGANTTIASTDSLSESRRSTEKRAFTFGGPSSNRLSGGYRGVPTAGSDGEDEDVQGRGNDRGEELLDTRTEGSFDQEPHQSQPRFVRHEDAGLIEGAHESVPNDNEVVDLPPLYQDAGRNQVGTQSVVRDQATINSSGSKSGLR